MSKFDRLCNRVFLGRGFGFLLAYGGYLMIALGLLLISLAILLP